jgi:hypothetical protein
MGRSRFKMEPQGVLAYGSITTSYVAIGNPLEFMGSKLRIANLTNATLQFSLDGINDHFPLHANSTEILDITVESKNADFTPIGTIVYVKRIGTPTSGSVYVTSCYGTDD